MSDYSLQRSPIDRAANGGITMREIEAEVASLYSGTLSADKVREKAFLFALLKQGSSLQKLQWFTGYDMGFIRERVEGLRAAGRLVTNTPSTQYLQNQVAGCEVLIERITGQRVVPMVNAAAPRLATVVAESNPKEESMNATTTVNGAADIENFQQTCTKTPGCPRKDRHSGRCAGAELKPRRSQADSPEQQRAANAERMRLARAEKKTYGRATRDAAPAKNGYKPQTVTAALASITGDGHYKIQYEDETRQFSFEGIGREAFIAALKSAEAALAGGA